MVRHLLKGVGGEPEQWAAFPPPPIVGENPGLSVWQHLHGPTVSESYMSASLCEERFISSSCT